ncbi:MAG TPA: hypothetical protein VF147_03340, partial [Vicinamibacterales bacterium]
MESRRVSVARVLAAGCAAAVLVLLIGGASEVARFGLSTASAAARVEQDVRAAFVEMTGDVERVAHDVAQDPAVQRAMASTLESDESARTLFDAAARARARNGPEDLPVVAVTIYNRTGDARGWAGRASDLPAARPPAVPLFVAPSPLGLRLVYLERITSPGPERTPLGSVAVEHGLTPARAGSMLLTTSEYVMPTSRAPVLLRIHDPRRPATRGVSFVVHTADGSPLVDAEIAPGQLDAGRARVRRVSVSIAVALIGVTVLLLCGPLLDERTRAGSVPAGLRLTLVTVVLLIAGSALFWTAFSLAPWSESSGHRTAFRLLLGGAGAVAVA